MPVSNGWHLHLELFLEVFIVVKTSSTSHSTRLARMYKYYGRDLLHNCAKCVNCQNIIRGKDAKMCICYGEGIEWDSSSVACGLFNKPFRGIRPRPRPLADMFEHANLRQPNEQEISQLSIF